MHIGGGHDRLKSPTNQPSKQQSHIHTFRQSHNHIITQKSQQTICTYDKNMKYVQ